jgi:peptidyl-prolyl cis-trans isomerase SurA
VRDPEKAVGSAGCGEYFRLRRPGRHARELLIKLALSARLGRTHNKMERRLKIMKRFAVIAAMLLACTALFSQTIDTPLAIVKLTKQKVITVKQAKSSIEKLEASAGRKLTLEERKQYLDSLIAETLIEQAAERDKITVPETEFASRLQTYRASLGPQVTDAQFETALKAQGMTLDDFKTQLRKQLITEKYILAKKQPLFASVKAPSEDEIKTFYDTYSAQFVRPDTVRFNYILVETVGKTAADKSKAKELIDGLAKQIGKNASKFDELMIKSATANAGYKGGDFGYLPKNNPQGQALLGTSVGVPFTLKVGEISDVLESSVGFYIIKLTEVLGQKFLDLSDPVQPGVSMSLREYIRNQIGQTKQQQVLQAAVGQIMAELKTSDTVTVYEKNLNW